VTPTTQTRSVAVQVDGLQLVIEIEGGAAWLLVRVDGEPAPGYAGGRTHRRGDRIEFSAQESISVRTGSSGATFFTFNGVDLGALGRPGIPETWVFDAQGHRKSG
jgi:hypothetical protein